MCNGVSVRDSDRVVSMFYYRCMDVRLILRKFQIPAVVFVGHPALSQIYHYNVSFSRDLLMASEEEKIYAKNA